MRRPAARRAPPPCSRRQRGHRQDLDDRRARHPLRRRGRTAGSRRCSSSPSAGPRARSCASGCAPSCVAERGLLDAAVAGEAAGRADDALLDAALRRDRTPSCVERRDRLRDRARPASTPPPSRRPTSSASSCCAASASPVTPTPARRWWRTSTTCWSRSSTTSTSAGSPGPRRSRSSTGARRWRWPAQAVGDPQATLVEPRRGADGEGSDADAPPAGASRAPSRAEMEVRKRRLGVLSLRRPAVPAGPGAGGRRRPGPRPDARPVAASCSSTSSRTPTRCSGRCSTRAFTGHATMVLIGDPKQAIYAFRGGDVVTYLAARRDRRHHRHARHQLPQRRALLVARCRRCCAAPPSATTASSSATCAARHAGRRLEGAPRPAPFRLRLVDRPRFGVPPGKGVGIGRIRELVAADLGRDVRALLDQRSDVLRTAPVAAGDVAVLCETRGAVRARARRARRRPGSTR